MDVVRSVEGRFRLPLRAYCQTGAWNDHWSAGDEVEPDVEEETSASGGTYLRLRPTPALADYDDGSQPPAPSYGRPVTMPEVAYPEGPNPNDIPF